MELSRLVVLADGTGPLQRIAGIDVHYSRDGSRAIASAALFSFPDMEPQEEVYTETPVPFPYVPGYLSFREAPAALAALERLAQRPDLIMCDGQGIAHPRRFGLACHLGVLSGLPSLGVAKSRLVGKYQEPGPAKGEWAPLIYNDGVVGAVVRTRDGARPVFVSPGHLLSLPRAIEMTLACTSRFRQPEPLRLAHRLAKARIAVAP
jgi:deoxyribonuclease V